ncbi:hypothetical protein Kisp01_14050 [Kineosporia sp. NBRC 101677]|uniref:hypothetical protein n=1 Tax=Kineosporia sp. NBRC 101677 TaxID=3032197 RepID=UPI0024A36729|nr:hypothetical protein [Kineosporia sp. NBRC 101677]GLY14390.1 hypothetical protein Kisp01_14050 [Kineosporia sp. NBRC 101677]
MEDDDDELTILVGAAEGSTALERDGMLRRLEESVTLAIAECTNEGYLTNGLTGDVDISLTVAAPGLAAPEVLSLVGDSVAALINDPANPGWGPFSVSVTGESADVTEGLDDVGTDLQVLDDLDDLDDLDETETLVVIEGPDGLSLTGIATTRSTEAGRARLLTSAELLTSVDLAQLTPLDLQAEDEEARQEAEAQARFVAGALFQASVAVVDQLFIDLDTLTRDGTTETVADAPDDVFFVLGGLPDRYADRYDALFTQRLIIATADVTRRLTAGWEPLACVAHELALRLILDATEVQLDLVDVELEPGWRQTIEEHLFADTEHEILYDPQTEDDEDDEDLRARPDSAPLGFAHWFTPFGADLHLPPYLVEGYTEDDLEDFDEEEDDLEDEFEDDLEDGEGPRQEHQQH